MTLVAKPVRGAASRGGCSGYRGIGCCVLGEGYVSRGYGSDVRRLMGEVEYRRGSSR